MILSKDTVIIKVRDNGLIENFSSDCIGYSSYKLRIGKIVIPQSGRVFTEKFNLRKLGKWEQFRSSFVGYASILLIVYKIGIKWVNCFFSYTSKIGYEWYLVHSLTFIVLHHCMDGIMPIWMILMICLIGSYGVAWLFYKLYHGLAKK